MVVVAENGSNGLSVIGGDGKKKPLGSSQNLFKSPTGVATDTKRQPFCNRKVKKLYPFSVVQTYNCCW